MRTVLHGAFWLAVYLAVVLTPLVVLLLAPTPAGGGFWWDVAIGFGFAGLVMMGVQFLLTARFRRATAPFGIDAIYYFHRYLAYVAVAVLLAHPVVLIAINPALLSYMNPFAAPWEMAAGTTSLFLLLVLVASSAWRKRLRIPYEAWRVAHLLLASGAVGLALAHMGGIGYYAGTPAVRVLWVGIGFSLVGIVVWVRVLGPWRLLRSPFRVTDVRPEPGDSWTLALEPEGHEGFSFDPGQFAWVSLGHSPFAMKEHPFSIASSPSPGGRLEFTIKELGDFTRTVGRIRPGEAAYVDGPYGAFSIDRCPEAAGYVFIAGGIGVAPIVSMLRALADRGDTRPHRLFQAHSRLDRVPLGEAVAELEKCMDLRVVHVLEDPPEGWAGERGWITREMLDRHLPTERRDLEYFVCGPVPMNRAVGRYLRELGIPTSRIHTELFDLV
ncbi:MAG: ferric reductase-like transmembrane domain-containing protein [Gemmatimonadota bacterium]